MAKNHVKVPTMQAYCEVQQNLCKTVTLKKTENWFSRPQLLFNAGQKYCSKGKILQYFRPSLSYHLSLRTLFCLCEWPFYTDFTV